MVRVRRQGLAVAEVRTRGVVEVETLCLVRGQRGDRPVERQERAQVPAVILGCLGLDAAELDPMVAVRIERFTDGPKYRLPALGNTVGGRLNPLKPCRPDVQATCKILHAQPQALALGA
jgi:hypothetical protein